MGCTWAGSRITRRQKCKAVGVVSVGNCICVCIDIYIFLGLAAMPMGFVHTPFSGFRTGRNRYPFSAKHSEPRSGCVPLISCLPTSGNMYSRPCVGMTNPIDIFDNARSGTKLSPSWLSSTGFLKLETRRR